MTKWAEQITFKEGSHYAAPDSCCFVETEVRYGQIFKRNNKLEFYVGNKFKLKTTVGLNIAWTKQNRSAGSQFETSDDRLGALKERWNRERAYT